MRRGQRDAVRVYRFTCDGKHLRRYAHDSTDKMHDSCTGG